MYEARSGAGRLAGLFEGRRVLNVAEHSGIGLLNPAHPPIPVTVRFVGQDWGDEHRDETAYALGWTRDAVLVLVWLPRLGRPTQLQPVMVWMPPKEVSRR